jgi:uncharacterized protein
MKLPTVGPVDRRLHWVNTLSGVGQGLAVFCPGPGLVALEMGKPKALDFVAAILTDMVIFQILEKRQLSVATSA